MDERLHILVVDDDDVDRMAVNRALKATTLPIVIHEVSDSVTALDVLTHTAFDCIFLDYRLPGTDGLAVVQEVRGRGISTPIVMLTGQGDERLAVELMKAGATDYLKKDSVTPEQLAQSLRHAQRVHRAEMQARQSADNLRFLSEASRTLIASLDEATICESLVHLPVPILAEWCVVDMLSDEGVLRRVGAPSSDSSQPDIAILLNEVLPIERDAPYSPNMVLTDGQPQLATDDLPSPFTAVMSVPMPVRGRVIGVISFASRTRRYTATELAVAADLGQRAAVAIDNARLYREAQDAIRLRDVFLSVASHELKTPLTSLFGNAQLLQRRTERDGSLGEREQRTLRVMIEQTARLNKMITALLDISRIQTGQFSIDQQAVDLCELITRLAEEMRPTLMQHTLAVSCAPEPATIIGDDLRLEQVLQNLVQNAVKYSPNGGEIRLSVEVSEGQALVSVSDQGIGIPAAAIPHLFDRFYRASNASDKHISGIGVGLFVVKEIVMLHGGTVSVESVEGQGSTFTIALPLQGAPIEDLVEANAP